ncbi:hypothetical protein O0I10_009991 [Lichtheimia ornata]|uniref:Uncharacterized protein n=1 Tax=Lichtheimia ornata TaxID=688661 RepID=A0AAD7UY96_9FUNG|nr:uncharacterized protein O0I10_009991 [Lichtheimia ornata]KAJ8654296.1 hypothetical protein O0I10_009991 [Lichtheimia ornata]
MRFLTVLFIAVFLIAIHMHTANAVPLRGTHSSVKDLGKKTGQHGANPKPGDTGIEPGSSSDSKVAEPAAASDQYTSGKLVADQVAQAAGTVAGAAGSIPGVGGGKTTSNGAASGSGTSSNGGATSGRGTITGTTRYPSGKETEIY